MLQPIPRHRFTRPALEGGLCALLAVFSLPLLLGSVPALTHSALLCALWAVCLGLGARLLCCRERRLKRFSLAFGAVFAFCQLLGARLDGAGTVGGGLAPLWLLTATLGFAPAAGCCFAALARGVQAVNGRLRRSPAHPQAIFSLALGVILLCWLPYYLAYFPGMFNFDSAGEAAQFTSGVYDGAFPPLHTLVLAGFYYLGGALGSYNAGIALYTGVQAVALAAAMALAVRELACWGLPRPFWIGALLCYALLPFFPLLAMSTTKDVFCCAALLPLVLRLYRGWREPSLWSQKSHWIKTALLGAAVCLFRPNGAAALLFGALGAALWIRPWKARRRALLCLLCGLVLFVGVNQGLNAALQPKSAGIRELLSLPLSQVARVYTQAEENGTTLGEKDEILSFLPDAHRYQPHLADGVKRHTTVGLRNMPSFLNLYFRLLSKYPAVYVDAAAALTKGYWHLDDTTHLMIYAERGKHGYMETANQDGYGVTRQSLWPGLEKALDELFVDNGYLRIPLLSIAIEPAFWCWLFLAALWTAAYGRRRGALLCGVALAGVYLTLLLGACAYMRYAFPLAVCALPVMGMGKERSDE